MIYCSVHSFACNVQFQWQERIYTTIIEIMHDSLRHKRIRTLHFCRESWFSRHFLWNSREIASVRICKISSGVITKFLSFVRFMNISQIMTWQYFLPEICKVYHEIDLFSRVPRRKIMALYFSREQLSWDVESLETCYFRTRHHFLIIWGILGVIFLDAGTLHFFKILKL